MLKGLSSTSMVNQVQKCKLFAIACWPDNENLLSTSSVGFWREPTIQELDSEEIS